MGVQSGEEEGLLPAVVSTSKQREEGRCLAPTCNAAIPDLSAGLRPNYFISDSVPCWESSRRWFWSWPLQE